MTSTCNACGAELPQIELRVKSPCKLARLIAAGLTLIGGVIAIVGPFYQLAEMWDVGLAAVAVLPMLSVFTLGLFLAGFGYLLLAALDTADYAAEIMRSLTKMEWRTKE